MLIPNKYNGHSIDGKRLYRKGGDGGAGAARQQEEQRQARINAAVATINSIFDSKSDTKANRVDAFVPGTTYYTADGQEFKPARNPSVFAGALGAMVGDPTRMYDQSSIDQALAAGLYTSPTPVAGTDREALYADQKKAVYDLNSLDVNKQYTEAERQNRFGLARAGLAGGSADIDSNAELQERTNKGLIQAAGIADGAAAELKTADERSRQSLISMAQSGIDTGTAQTMALNQLNATAQTAQANRGAATVGNLFGDLSQAYLTNQIRLGQQAGARTGTQTYGVSNPRTGDAGYINK